MTTDIGVTSTASSLLAVGFFEQTLVIGVLLALAAAAGTALRHLADGYLNGDFPTGTLLVNLAASFLLGVVSAIDDPVPVIIGIGALGALSTWSATAAETANLARRGDGKLAAGYVCLTVTSGILTAWFGLKIGQVLF